MHACVLFSIKVLPSLCGAFWPHSTAGFAPLFLQGSRPDFLRDRGTLDPSFSYVERVFQFNAYKLELELNFETGKKQFEKMSSDSRSSGVEKDQANFCRYG